MWLRLLIIFLLFGFLAVFQTSFLEQLDILGATPNFIFILFFLIAFFSAQGEASPFWGGEDILFSAITAGFFLDTLYSFYFGGAIILLLIITFVLKRLLSMLKKTRDKYPIVYFAPLFVLSLIFFNLFLTIATGFLDFSQVMPRLSWVFLVEAIYNLVFAVFGFYIYKTLKLYEFRK